MTKRDATGVIRQQLDRLQSKGLVEIPQSTPRINVASSSVQSASAGAGSGEFHVYKNSRRRESERIDAMAQDTTDAIESRAYEEAKRKRELADLAKTEKNRLKRLKRRKK